VGRHGTNKESRLAVLCDNVHLEAVPFVREPLVHLAAEGFMIDLVAPTASYGYPDWTPVAGVRQLVVSGYRGRPTMEDARTLSRLALRGLVRSDYAAVLATPIVSVVLGAALAALWRVPLVVLSDELYTEGDPNNPHPRWHGAMHRAHARAALTIITDLRRAEVLRNESDLLEDQPFVELPNSPSGAIAMPDRGEFRKRIRVGADDVLVLHSGGLWPWTRAPELMSALPSLPADTTVVFQMNTRADASTRQLYELLECAYPVRFLPDPVPYMQVDEAVTACDIGIALYRDESPNIALTGKGSGKLTRYLRAGKPVIVDRTGGLEWVAEYGAGEMIDGMTELPRAIEMITSNYDHYAERARDCFVEHLSFERCWPVVRAALADVIDDDRFASS
jgi:glycosyltransferase involved in cell wall biosynthesis